MLTDGVLAAVRRLGATLVAMAGSRVELVASDLEEQRAWLTRLVALGAIAFALGIMACVSLAALVVAALWEQRLVALGALAAVFLLAALWVLGRLATEASRRPKFFAATLAVLEEDRAALDPRRE